MDQSRVWQQELSRTLNKDILSINAYTRRLLYSRPLLNASYGNYSIPINITFNLHYKSTDYLSLPIGSSNGWKLNIEQYLFPYSNEYNLKDFKAEDYVYIDDAWKIHRFIKYTTKTINNQSVSCYYGHHNDSLRLYVYPDGTSEIVDLNNNKYCFNTNGRLKKLISGVNSEIVKELTYNQDKITSIYDTRDSNIGFTLSYTDNLLTSITNKEDNNTISFEYTYYNKISKIKQTYKNKTRDLAIYKYDAYYNIKNIIDCQTCIGFDLDYEKIDSDYFVTMIQEVTYKKEPTHILGSAMHGSEDLYLSNDKYYEKNAKYYNGDRKYIDTSNAKNQMIYYKENTQLVVQKPNGYEIVYYFDIEGNVISQLEKKNTGKYHTLFKTNGWLLSENGTNSETINNNKATTLSNKKFTLNIDDNNKNNNFNSFIELFDHDISFIRNNNLEDFYVAFWLKTSNDIKSDLEHELKFTYPSTTISKKFRLNLAKAGTWQYVKVPIVLSKKVKKVEQLDILFNETLNYGTMYIADVRIGVGTNTRVYIQNKCLEEDHQINYQLNDYAIAIDKTIYLTVGDVEKTYRSLYINKFENNNSFDLTCCNGQYVLDVKEVELDNFIDRKFKVDDKGIPNFRTQVSYKQKAGSFDIVEQQHRYTYLSDIGKHIHEIKTSYDNVNQRNDEQKENRSYRFYTRTSFDGLLYSKQDRNDLIIDYAYDSYGNLTSVVTKNDNDSNNKTIVTNYLYKNSDPSCRKQPYKVSDNTNSIEYKNHDYYGFIQELTNGGIKVIYEFDHFNECIETIKFVNVNDSKIIKTHKLFNNNNMIHRIINNDTNKYNYYYNNDLELSKIYDDHNLLLEIQKENNMSGLILKEIEKEYSADGSKILDYVKKYYYDNYDKLYSIQEGIDILAKKETEIEYQGQTVIYDENRNSEDKSRYYNDYLKNQESALVQKPLTFYDPYRKVLIVFYYDGTNNLIGFDERSIDYVSSNRRFIEKYLESEHKLRYKLYNYNGLYDDYIYYLNYTYDTDEKDINSPDKRVIKTSYTKKNADGEVAISKSLDKQYYYDYFGRLACTLYFEVSDLNQGYKIENIFDEHTNLLKERKLSEMIDPEKLQMRSLTEILEYDIINKTNNITKITENDETIILTNKKLNQSKIKHYEYDVLGNLSKETYENQYTYNYEYDLCGNITKITKNGQLHKEFTYNHDRLLTYKIDNSYKEIEYDLRGNITRIGNQYYRFNTKNLLEEYKCGRDSDTIVNYYYSNEGVLYRKTKKTLVNGVYETDYDVNYYLDNNKILAEFKENVDGVQKLQYFYDLNGISAILYKDKVYNLIKDSLGSISKIICQGKILAEYEYDAWGNTTIKYLQNDLTTDECYVICNNPFRYRGYYYDVETQLFYCNSRYYSPELCRWISPDSIEYLDPQSINGLNLYCYCMNNPINKYDPSGHFAISAALFIGTIVVGALIGGGTAAYSSIKKGDEWYEVALKTLSGAALGGMLGAAMGTGAALAAGGTIAGLSVSASVAVGMGVTVGGSAVLGATNSFVNQIIDNDWDISKVSASRIGTDALVAGIKGLLSFGAGAWTGGAGLWNVPKGAAPGFLNAATKIYLNTVIGTGLKLSVDAIYAMLLGEECGWINGLKGVIDWVF